MRVYAVVEGKTEAKLYSAWLKYAYPGMSQVRRIEDVREDTYFLFGNMGYPCVLGSVENAVQDIVSEPGSFDLLLIALDADEADVDERREEVVAMLSGCPIPTVLAIQDCCVETWLLGNGKMVPSHDGASASDLASYRAHYDVRSNDPELMDAPEDYALSVMQYHYRYLKAVFKERRQAYSKRAPGAATAEHYVSQLVRRYVESGHLKSFGRFLEEFRAVGAGGPFL